MAAVTAGFLGIAMPGPVGALAQDAPQPENKLQEIERSLESARSRAGRLEEEMSSIAEDQADLQQKLVETAARIQSRETQITAGEDRLVELGDEDAELRARLGQRRNAMGSMLAALQKLEREPPPVLAVRPGDAVAAIRSAMLLSTVVPRIRAEAEALSRSLRRLAALRDEIIEEQRQLTFNHSQLGREQEVIERLLDVKNQLAARTAKERDAARQRAEALAEEAGSLKELLAKLEEDRLRQEEERERELAAAEARSRAAEAAGDALRTAQPSATPQDQRRPSPQEARLAMTRPDRLKPAVAFVDAKGTLSLPARGAMVRRFGADDGYGGTAKGVPIETRPRAQVTTPAGGWVVYAGKFRGYGQLLIIDAGDGYHVLLAGMSRIDVTLGQFVVSGEPVGLMGAELTQSAALGATADREKPVLYVEFRENGTSIDPQPWWAATTAKARG